MESKKDIRRRVLANRTSMSKEEWEEKSRRICKKVIAHPFFLDADCILCYLDYRNEVGTKELMEQAWKLGKKVAVPKICGYDMIFQYIDSFEHLVPGYCNILEPSGIPSDDKGVLTGSNALVIMPGVAFDKYRHRIGYGKGFYDRYLANHPEVHTAALAFELQMVEYIVPDEHDICPELVVTEDMIYG